MACKPRIFNSWSTSLVFAKLFWNANLRFNSKFLKQIYRSLARVLRKLGRKMLNLELQIFLLAISLRNLFNRVVLGSYKSLQYLLKTVLAYKLFQIGCILLCFLLVILASFSRSTSLRSWSSILWTVIRVVSLLFALETGDHLDVSFYTILHVYFMMQFWALVRIMS
jgi:heme/copper-type cytochrome/quinol oxidase subunit 4